MDVLTWPWPGVWGSAPPRRREILSRIVGEFAVDSPDIDEDALTRPDPVRTALDLACMKAKVVAERHPEAIVIGGDTVVAVPDGEGFIQLAKPNDRDDAIRMLTMLSGREHLVITGVCLIWPQGLTRFHVTSGVTFKSLTHAEIEAYVDAGESMDKAGAYAAQGKAAEIIAAVDGSMTNVIGLPEDELRAQLWEIGYVASGKP